jgi:Lipocalin-like domain
VSYVARAEDGSLRSPLGPNPRGSLIYTADGWMLTQVCASDRARFATEDLRGVSDAERANAFSSYVAYCGSYEVSGDVVIHRVTMSLFPNWVGSEQKRYFELEGDELTLRTPPLEVEGTLLVNELRWHREEG